jgi:hypothetical protein
MKNKTIKTNNITITINENNNNYYVYFNFYEYIKKYDYEILKLNVKKALRNTLKLNEFSNVKIISNNLISFEIKTNDKKQINLFIYLFNELLKAYFTIFTNKIYNDININTNDFLLNLINEEYNNFFISENKEKIIKNLKKDSIKTLNYLYENLIFTENININKVDPIKIIESLKEY